MIAEKTAKALMVGTDDNGGDNEVKKIRHEGRMYYQYDGDYYILASDVTGKRARSNKLFG
jgi:hypothetical protein